MKLRGVLSKNLKRLRKEKRLTQESLAYTANLERSYISKLERRLSSASVDTVEKLATALEIKAWELLVE
jgi:transcriptional regulator with XRE-family HTH domain